MKTYSDSELFDDGLNNFRPCEFCGVRSEDNHYIGNDCYCCKDHDEYYETED